MEVDNFRVFLEKRITYVTTIVVNDITGVFINYWSYLTKGQLTNNFLNVGISPLKNSVIPLSTFNIKLIDIKEKYPPENCDIILEDKFFTIDVYRLRKEKDFNSDFIKKIKDTYNKDNFSVILFDIEDIKDSSVKNCLKLADKIKSKLGINEIIFLPYNTESMGKLFSIIDGFLTSFKSKLASEFNKRLQFYYDFVTKELDSDDLFENTEKAPTFVTNSILYLDLLTLGEFWYSIRKFCDLVLYKNFKGLKNDFIFAKQIDPLTFDINYIKKKAKSKEVTNMEYQGFITYNYIRSCRYLRDYVKLTNFICNTINRLYLYESLFKSIYHFIYWRTHCIYSFIEYFKAFYAQIPLKDKENLNTINEGIINLYGLCSYSLKNFAEKVKIALPSKKIFVLLKKWMDEKKDIKEEINKQLNEGFVNLEKDEKYKEFKEDIKNFYPKLFTMFTNKKAFIEEYLFLLQTVAEKHKNRVKFSFSYRCVFEIIPLLIILNKLSDAKQKLLSLLEYKFINYGKWTDMYQYISFFLVLLLNCLEKNNENLNLMFRLLNTKYTKLKILLKIFECDDENIINGIMSKYIESFEQKIGPEKIDQLKEKVETNNDNRTFSLDEIIEIKLNKEKDNIIFINKSKHKNQQIKYKFTNKTGIIFNVEKIQLVFEEIYSGKDNIEEENQENIKVVYNIESDKNNFKCIESFVANKEDFFNIEVSENDNSFKLNAIYQLKEIIYIMKNAIQGVYHINEELKLSFNSIDMQISTQISPSYDTPNFKDNNFFFNVLSMIDINISNIPDTSDFDDKTLQFQFSKLGKSESTSIKMHKEVLAEKMKEIYPGIIIKDLSIIFPPGSLKDKDLLQNIQIPFYMENTSFYSNDNEKVKILTTIKRENDIIYSFVCIHNFNIIHLFNLREKYRLLPIGNYLMQLTFSLNIEANNVKVYTHNSNENAFVLDSSQAVNLVLLLNNKEEEIVNKLHKHFLDFTIDETKKYRLCYPENCILEEIKELKEVPYQISIEVEDVLHERFNIIDVFIKIKKLVKKKVLLQINLQEDENWSFIGKSKIIEEFPKEDCERLVRVQILPLIDGFLKLPEIEFTEYDMEGDKKSNEEIEFEPIQYGTVIEGNEKVVKITPLRECILRLNLT